MKNRNLRFLFYLCLLFIGADVLLFRIALWRIPDEIAWGDESYYKFLRNGNILKKTKSTDEFRVLITGSSIAEYSVIEKNLESILNGPDYKTLRGEKKVKVYVLAHQGQHTMNLLASSDAVLDARPDLIIHPVNMVDFRLEQELVLGLEDELNSEDIHTKDTAYKKLAVGILGTNDIQLLSPCGELKFFSGFLNRNEIASSVMACISSAYRYRLIASVPIQRILNNHLTKGHSYHFYSGIPVGGGGINQNGYTGKSFDLLWNETFRRQGIEIEASDELFQSPSRAGLYFQKGCTCGNCSEKPELIPLKRGWQTVEIPELKDGEAVCFTVEPGYDSEIYGDELGVRLSSHAGRNFFGNSIRELRREDNLYLSYSQEQYRQSFERRIMKFNRSGMAYLEMLTRTKKRFTDMSSLDRGLPAYRAFDDWRKLVNRCSSLLIVNSPENPISLDWYGKSQWYDEYLKFISCPPGSLNCAMADAGRLLGSNYFYDFHHLSYYGAEKFTGYLGEKIREKLKEDPAFFKSDPLCGRAP